jgi:hypothetical protein
MSFRDDLIAYQVRWDMVEKRIQEERKNASPELRWRQLNAAYSMGQRLGLQRDDASELEVINLWAKLKSQTLEA